MPPLSGERHNIEAASARQPLQETGALRTQQENLFVYMNAVQPIRPLAWLAGKLGLIEQVESPKVTYQAAGQEGNAHTRAWLRRDLSNSDQVSLLTDVVHIEGESSVVPGSEQVQLVISRGGQMLTDPANILTPEVTQDFLDDSADTAHRVDQEMSRLVISRNSYI